MIDNIVEDLNKQGYHKTTISKLVGDNKYYKATNELLHNALKEPHIVDLCKRIKTRSGKFSKKKYYEIAQKEILGRGLKLTDNVIQLYLEDPFVKVAKAFYEEDDIKMFNVLTWIHPEAQPSRMASQAWHRDQEDFKILKCFIYHNDIEKENGALDYFSDSAWNGTYGTMGGNMVDPPLG